MDTSVRTSNESRNSGQSRPIILGHLADFSPSPPFAMLKRLENVLFSVRKASGLYNIERGKGYRPQRCQMPQELLSETVALLFLT